MTYTNAQINDSVKRVTNWIKERNNKEVPLTVRVNKDTLKIDQYKALVEIKDAKNRVDKWIKEHNGTYPEYVTIKDYKFPKVQYEVFWGMKQLNKPTSTSNATYNKFVELFGKPKDFDDALRRIENHGYGHYYNNKYTNAQTLINLKNRKNSPNCTDLCQTMHKVAEEMKYTVQCVHVKCRSGEGHVFLRLKHSVNTKDDWIYRDPASVASTGNNNGVRGMWCSNGTVLAYNPQWYLNDLNK